MQQEHLFPRMKSHAHYPFPVVRLANNANHGAAKKVFENWDTYTQRQAERKLSVSLNEFVERYGYQDLAVH